MTFCGLPFTISGARFAPPRCVTVFLAWIALPIYPRHTAHADWPQPKLTSVSRAGSRAGEPVHTTIRGTDLEGAKQLWFDHPGIVATHIKDTTFRVIAAPDVPLGHHDVRAVGAYGVSNPRTFVIGDRPEAAELEPNNVPAQATPVMPGTVINGEIASPTDVDLFSLDGKRGQRLMLDLEAERIESRLDATIRVIRPDGTELAESRDLFGVDPFLDVTLPSDGRYLIKVHDAVYGGSPDHIYRLTIHDGPHLDAILPLAALPGTSPSFTLFGRGLGSGASLDSKVKSDGVALERMSLTIPLPARPEDWISRSELTRSLVPSSSALLEPGVLYRHVRTSPEGAMPVVSNPWFIAQAEGTVITEVEPNNDGAHAQPVVPACDISGTFGTSGDVDLYQFSGRKGDVWWIEAFCERIGSQADPSLVIQKVEADGKSAQDIASADDIPDAGLGPRFSIQSSDAALRWQVPDDGTYRIAITDLFGSQRGQPRLTYRLVIRKERPDFAVTLVPESTSNADGFTLRAGGRGVAYALALRKEGFRGPIWVEPRSLPPGVTAKPTTIAAAQTIAPIVFDAAETAKPSVGVARFAGLGEPPAGTTHGHSIERPSVAGGMIWPPPSITTAPTVAPSRLYSDFVVAVLPDPAPLVIDVKPETATVLPGQRIDLEIKVKRRAGFTDAVSLTTTDLPASLPSVTATLAKDASTTRLPLFVPKSVAPGTFTILARGTGNIPFSKDATVKNKPNINISTPSNPIMLTVRPAPVQLTVNPTAGSIKRGATLATSATISRQLGFKGPVTLTLSAPATLGLIAKPVVIAENAAQATLDIESKTQSPEGPAAGVYLRASFVSSGSAEFVEEPLSLTIEK